MAARTLILVRHAKAAEPDDAVRDQDRALTSRGQRDARALGERLASSGSSPDLVLCSPAARARGTWDLVEAQLRHPTTVRYEPTLYQASAREMLGLVRGAEDAVRSLVVVGHNPATHELAVMLAGSGEKTAVRSMTERYPTCATAVLGINGPWDKLGENDAELLDLIVPSG